jgi:hypothetical protein
LQLPILYWTAIGFGRGAAIYNEAEGPATKRQAGAGSE